MTSTNSKHGWRLGVDVGGTFTDLVLSGPEGQIFIKKVTSTPGRYDEGIVTGVAQIIEDAKIPPNYIQEIRHSTTAATNSVLERTGAKVGLITTKGFRDVLELRRLRTPSLYNLFYTPPPPLVPRYLRLEVNERIDSQGAILKDLDQSEVRHLLSVFEQEHVESVAVCLINSYKNPSHEKTIGSLLQDEYKDLFVSLSHEIVPAIREYERTSTTVANAYLMPVMNSYLSSLRNRMTNMGIKAPILVMQSNGGMMTSHRASQRPIFSLESGPVAGVSGALHLAKTMKMPDLLTFDMGGTTTKAAVIEKGEPLKSSEYEIGAPISRGSRLLKGGGYLLMVRAVDVAEVGAGGGSIVSLDKAGSFQVGPRSAGADPGPICYDRGGEEPTTSDANVILGYLNPEYLLGGSLEVNIEKAKQLFQSKVASPLGLTLTEAAYGVHMVANATMARAMRSVTTERGRDARWFNIMAFGGSGPCHAAALAKQLGIRQVIIPSAPGLFSSLGLLSANQEYEFVNSLMIRTSDMSESILNDYFSKLESEARDVLQQEGYNPHSLVFLRYADIHYAAQIHELTVPVPTSGRIFDLEEAFGREHDATYGYRSDKEPMEITNLRVVGYQTKAEENKIDLASIGTSLYTNAAPRRSRKAYFGRAMGFLDTPIISRADLDHLPTQGPVIVEEYDTTVVAPPDCNVSRDHIGNIILRWE